MSYKGPRSWLRPLCTVLWMLTVGILAYQNHMLQITLQKLERNPSQMAAEESEMAMELNTLIATNKTYSLDLKREHINLKECMSKLPQKEIDDFYRRHRQELQNEMEKRSLYR